MSRKDGIIRSTRREFLMLGAAGLTMPLMPRLAFAQEVALPPAAEAFGATVKAMGPAPNPIRIAMLSFQGSSFWEAVDQGIAAATPYLKELNTTVDNIQLGTGLTAEVVIAGIDGALAKQYQGIATIPIFDGTVAKVNEAVAAGVPFIAFIADSAEKSNRTVGMGQLAYDAGQERRRVHRQAARRQGQDRRDHRLPRRGPARCADERRARFPQEGASRTSPSSARSSARTTTPRPTRRRRTR